MDASHARWADWPLATNVALTDRSIHGFDVVGPKVSQSKSPEVRLQVETDMDLV
jgi:hypothetical protein